MIKPTKFISLNLTIFYIYHFVIEKIQILFGANSFCQVIREKIVPNYQTKSKDIFGRKKRECPITSTFVPMINLTNSS